MHRVKIEVQYTDGGSAERVLELPVRSDQLMLEFAVAAKAIAEGELNSFLAFKLED